MGIKEDVLALADDVESAIGGCYGCLLDKRGLCKAETDFDCIDEVCKFVANRLRGIVEDDAESVTTVSAYDLLPEDERKAIAWVREQGGLDLVKASVHQGAVEHGYLLIIAEMLGTSIYDGTDNADDLLEKLSERLMPEGVEWPRFEDGEPVRFLDDFERDGDENGVSAVTTYLDGSFALNFRAYSKGERVKRPAPKVVDADGVEILVGDTVYHVKDGSEMTVYGIEGEWLVVSVGGCVRHDIVTHRAPVLAADGKPLRVGDTVWKVGGDGTAYVFDGMSDYVDGLAMLHHDGKPYVGTGLRVDQLTHEQPDTWERLEHDAEKTVCEYFGANYDCANCPLETARCAEEVKKDIIRRAKKLAEGGA